MEAAETASWDQHLDLKSRFLTNESLRKTRARIFNLLKKPGIDSKEQSFKEARNWFQGIIPPASAAWQAGTTNCQAA